MKYLWRANYLQCKTTCDFRVSWADCRCTLRAEAVAGQTPSEMMKSFGVLSDAAGAFFYDEDLKLVDNLTDEQATPPCTCEFRAKHLSAHWERVTALVTRSMYTWLNEDTSWREMPCVINRSTAGVIQSASRSNTRNGRGASSTGRGSRTSPMVHRTPCSSNS